MARKLCLMPLICRTGGVQDGITGCVKHDVPRIPQAGIHDRRSLATAQDQLSNVICGGFVRSAVSQDGCMSPLRSCGQALKQAWE